MPALTSPLTAPMPPPPVQLTWFTQPYVQRLRYDAATDSVEATTLSLVATPRVDRFHVGEAREADSVHPLASFQARGRRYYLDAANFGDKALLVGGWEVGAASGGPCRVCTAAPGVQRSGRGEGSAARRPATRPSLLQARLIPQTAAAHAVEAANAEQLAAQQQQQQPQQQQQQQQQTEPPRP